MYSHFLKNQGIIDIVLWRLLSLKEMKRWEKASKQYCIIQSFPSIFYKKMQFLIAKASTVALVHNTP